MGSHLVDALVARDNRVTIVDDLSTGRRAFLNGAARFVEGDLRDERCVADAMKGIDFVFHFAANADIKDGLKHPRRDIEQNVVVTQNVLEAMRAEGVTNVAFASTGSVYGEPEVFPTPETCPFPVQTSLYATSKVCAEGLLSSYAHGFGFRVWIYRFVSMLGPRYTHGHVIDFWRKLRRDPTRLEVLGNGLQRKAYCHVLDCIDAMFAVVERSKEEPIAVYNLGHTDTLTVNESIAVITAELGVSPKLEYSGGVRGWVGDSPLIMLDTKKLRALGWEPRRSLKDSIIDTLRFLQANPSLAEHGP